MQLNLKKTNFVQNVTQTLVSVWTNTLHNSELKQDLFEETAISASKSSLMCLIITEWSQPSLFAFNYQNVPPGPVIKPTDGLL